MSNESRTTTSRAASILTSYGLRDMHNSARIGVYGMVSG